jgi:hypothetical protein
VRFVQTTRYLKDLKRLRASRDDVAEIERAIANNPFTGDVIPGLRGVRKLRFAIGNRGKRGGGRAVYFLMLAEDTAIMLFAYAKNEKEDLSAAEKKSALALISEMLDGQE